MFASKSLDVVIVEMESNIELVTDSEIDNLIFLLEPTIEILNSHVHVENLRPSIPEVLLAYILLKYCEKIRL